MTREEAIKKVRWGLLGLAIDKDVRDAFETLIPELRESKDEMIRKRLITLIRVLDSSFFTGNNPSKEQCLAWLEKQKEKGRNITANLLEDGITGVQRELIEFLTNNIDASWADIIKSADAYAQRIRSMVEKQKEQKPEERFEEAREKYQVEWSEEEKDKLKSIERLIVNANAHGNYLIGDKEATELQHFIRSIVKPTTNLAEWSEEDEKKMIFLERLIEYNVPDGQYGWADGRKGCFVTKSEAISMLKSLRPVSKESLQPHWKPCEEQMRCLDMVLCDEAMDDNVHRVLVQLREQLKKLMSL